MRKVLPILFMGTVSLLATGETQAANSVQKTADTCMNAHAILAASASGNNDVIWDAIGRAVKAQPYKWKVVADYEPMIAQKVSFRQYETRFVEGGSAFVAHCGHGGTCNELADWILKNYPDLGSPAVYCGDVPHILDNPTSAPSLP